MARLRIKMRQNVREMFLAHRHVQNQGDLARLLESGWRDLRTFQTLCDQDAEFFELCSRKK